jgi:hypothetical protein
MQKNPDGQTDGTTVDLLQKYPAGQGIPDAMPDDWQDDTLSGTDVAFPAHTFPGIQGKQSDNDIAPGMFLKVPSGQGVGRMLAEGQ